MMAKWKRDSDVEAVVDRIRRKMKPWGITITFLASQLGVSRQYAWQIVHYQTFLSMERALAIERAIDSIIAQKAHIKTFGERLRAARISAGLTLKEVAWMIGYSWVGVERWEKDQCLPKPGVLWHLVSLYGMAGQDNLQPALVPGGGEGSVSASRATSEHTVGVLGELPQFMRYLFAGPAAPARGNSPAYRHAPAVIGVQRKVATSQAAAAGDMP